MRHVEATFAPVDHQAWRGERAHRDHGPVLIDGPALVRDADTGDVVLAHVPVVDSIDLDLIGTAAEAVDYPGARMKRANGMFNRAATFGYRPRLPVYMQPGCSGNVMNVEQPELAGTFEAAATLVQPYYREHSPDRYERHLELARAIDPAWRMGGADGMFTQGIVNHTTAHPYHTDGGNFPDVWSGMLVARRDTVGGELVVPEYGVRLACPHGFVVLFDGQRLMHGVTPIVPTGPHPRRFTVVYYALSAMRQCLPPDDEVAYAQAARTATERRMHELTPDRPPVVYLIGEPGSGKSTLMAAFTDRYEAEARTAPFAHRVLRNADGLVIGVELGKRRDNFSGTDALAMNVGPKVRAWLAEVDAAEVVCVLGEGDRLTNGRFLTECDAVVRLDVPEAVADERRRQRGSDQNASWLKGRRTKLSNLADMVTDTIDGTAPLDEQVAALDAIYKRCCAS